MLYEIRFLKAPWPKGAKVGDVVDMPYLPAWAQGKCAIAADGAEETIEFEEPVAADGVNRPLVGAGAGQPALGVAALQDQLQMATEQLAGQGESIRALIADLKEGIAEANDLRAKLAAADDEKVRLMDQLDAATGAHADSTEARDAAVAEAADLRVKLAAAEAAATAKGGKK